MKFLRVIMLLGVSLCGAGAADLAASAKTLAAAQRARDLTAVQSIVSAAYAALGTAAGVPEAETEFVMPAQEVRAATAEQVPALFERPLDTIQGQAWWKEAKTGTDCQAPLRAVASVVEGCLLARQAGCAQPRVLLAEAEAAADFLVHAQQAGGRECFPFPGWRGKRGKLGAMAEAFLSKAEEAGKVDAVLHEGWIIDDLGTGDLYFDNGLAGVALLSMYEASKNEVYLTSARKAADWACTQPCVPNWNYNSFLVHLLAQTHRVTGDAKYLAAAKEKCRLGCLPGQLTSGPHVGRWGDPHNARLVYHFIILRGLLSLLAELPADDAERAEIENAVVLSLQTRNAEILEQGGTSPDTTLEIYTRLLGDRAHFGQILTRVPTTEAAAQLIFRVAVEEFKHEHPTVSPGSWGRYLLLMAGEK